MSSFKDLDLELEKILAEYGPKKDSGQKEPNGDKDTEENDYISFFATPDTDTTEKEQSGADVFETPEPAEIVSDSPAVPEPEQPEAQEQSELPEEKRSIWRWLLPRAFDVLLAVILIAATMMFLQNNDPNKSILGYRYYFIQSGSMEPELPIGSFILVKMTTPDEIHVGDNAAFYFKSDLSPEPEFWTHKVIEVIRDTDGAKFQTQGIANPAPDPFQLDSENVIGKVIYCNKFLGPVMMFASQNPLPLIAVVGAMFIFIHVVGRYGRKHKEDEQLIIDN